MTLVTTDEFLSTEQYGLGEAKTDYTSLHPLDTKAKKKKLYKNLRGHCQMHIILVSMLPFNLYCTGWA